MTEIPKKWHGYKLVSNYRITQVKASHGLRVIEYNPIFFNRLTQNQKIFLLDWCITNKRNKDLGICDEKTMNKCLKKGITKHEIYIMLETMNLKNKSDRIFSFLTEDAEKVEQKQIFKYLWKKIKELFTQL